MPYLGAFAAAAIATKWEPGNPSWQIRGYQPVITQAFVGAGINWIGESGSEITRVWRKTQGRSGDNQRNHYAATKSLDLDRF